MSNSVYASLTRQTGLMSELRIVANNVANANTTGFKAEGVVFSEFVSRTGAGQDGLSMARLNAKSTDLSEGGLVKTGGVFDFAISGDGYFAIETDDGPNLTRAGSFLPNAANELVAPDGSRVLDAGLAPIFVPPDAGDLSVSNDGTISVDGRPIAQIGIFRPSEGAQLTREPGQRFSSDLELTSAESFVVTQGFLESSNVNPIAEISRLIEVQRAYESGQSFLKSEDERIRSILSLIQR